MRAFLAIVFTCTACGGSNFDVGQESNDSSSLDDSTAPDDSSSSAETLPGSDSAIATDSSAVADSSDSTPTDTRPVDDSGCSIVHDNGVGQTWTDCVPLGTYNIEQAMKACAAAYGGDRTKCEKTACSGTPTPDGNAVCTNFALKTLPWGCWSHTGAFAGHAKMSPVGVEVGNCPSDTSPVWK
jgi:hypothetical protein